MFYFLLCCLFYLTAAFNIIYPHVSKGCGKLSKFTSVWWILIHYWQLCKPQWRWFKTISHCCPSLHHLVTVCVCLQQTEYCYHDFYRAWTIHPTITVRGEKIIYTSWNVCHLSLNDTFNYANSAKADVGFGVCLLLCQYVFSLFSEWWLVIGFDCWKSRLK